jgi:hypothetical protein
MLSRALSLAAVTLLIGCFAAAPAWAQATNLEAGKSPSQIFAGTCTACHKSPRGLLKTVPAGSLSGFLRQHYTTSSEMASLLSAFLVSNGAADSRYMGAPPKGAKDAKSDARPPEQLDRFGHRIRPAAPAQEAAKPEAEPQQAAKPDADGISPPQGRNAKRLARPGEPPDAAKPAIERGPDGRKLTAKQRLGKRGKPGGEEPLKMDEPAKGEPVKEDRPAAETAKEEGSKPEATKPAEATNPIEAAKPAESKSEPARVETPKDAGSGETPVLRADPVPAVTPAPPASPAASTVTTSAPPEPAAGPAPSVPAPPQAVTAAVPPPEPPPAAPAGPPVPPISK